jgi:hypothetical protein
MLRYCSVQVSGTGILLTQNFLELVSNLIPYVLHRSTLHKATDIILLFITQKFWNWPRYWICGGGDSMDGECVIAM